MLLRITHTTDLTYSDLISETVMDVRMAPAQAQDQHRLSFTLAVGPPTSVLSYFDWLGNTVHTFTVNGFHKNVRIVATSVVETDRPHTEPQRFADTWPVCADACDYTVYDYLNFGGPVVDSPLLRELVDIIQPQEGASLGELALRTMLLINEKFTYKKGITTAASPITDLLEKGSGVCQDFTHLMIGLARAMQIPARYVSGLIHPGGGERAGQPTVPTAGPNGDPNSAAGGAADAGGYRGFTQTHAWCELLFPSAGWIGFDPANACIVGGNFVKVAAGRDYHDVPPNKGTWRGNAKESIDVQVRTEELRAIPPELAAERFQTLDIPSYPAGSVGHREMVNQQREVQQQEIHRQQEQQQQQAE